LGRIVQNIPESAGNDGKSAQAHDSSLSVVSKEVFNDLKEKYSKHNFNYRKGISKQEINQ